MTGLDFAINTVYLFEEFCSGVEHTQVWNMLRIGL
jgi:hypothetical protein